MLVERQEVCICNICIYKIDLSLQLSEELDKVDEKLKVAEDLLESKVSILDITRCR